MTPSQTLIDQTTTAVPLEIVGTGVGFGLLLIAYRMLVIRDRRPTTTAAHWYALFIGVYAALRIGVVHDWVIAHLHITLGDVRLIGAMLQVCSAAALLLLGLCRRSRTGDVKTWVRPALIAGVTVVCIALLIIHEPVRHTGLAIEELDGSWRTGAYLTLHSFLFIPAELVVVATLWQMAKSTTSARRLLVTLLSLAIAFSAFNLLLVMGAGWLMSAGVDGPLTAPRSMVRNDLALYPTLLPWIPVGIPAVVVDIRRRLGLNRGPADRMTQLRPLWSDLTAVAPAYRLAELGPDDGLPSEAEREFRMRIELEEIIFAVSRYLPPDTAWPDTPDERAHVLGEACRLFAEQHNSAAPGSSPKSRMLVSTSRPAWATNDAELEAVANAWAQHSADRLIGVA